MMRVPEEECCIHKSGVKRKIRDVPPADYKLIIENFSILSEVLKVQKKQSYESSCFEAGGYKWRLSIYPYGDKKRKRNRHISIYLVLDDTYALPVGAEVIVSFKLFVYDQIQDNYLTVEDGDEGLKRFHKFKTAYGISDVISLASFHSTCNGYLVKDTCVFGVELLIINNTRKAECLSFTQIPDNQHDLVHTWKINNFSRRKNETYYSPDAFIVAGRKWKLVIHPRWENKWLSLGVVLHDTSYTNLYGLIRWLLRENDQKFYAECNLRVKNQLHDQHLERMVDDWFNLENHGWGYGEFINLTELHDPSNGFLVNDTLIVEAQFTDIFASNDLSGGIMHYLKEMLLW